MMLADLGADVIKIESPAMGDYLRLPETRHLHLQASKGKRSIAIDMKTERGREIFGRLLATSDAFVTNAIADRNDRLGLGYDQLKALKPDIVYCQNTGFGATGPFREVPSHGQMMDAMAGALPMMMGEDGLVVPSDRYRRRTGSLLSGGEGTAMGAIYSAFHIAAGLAHRERTGEGCFIDVSSAHAVVASGWAGVSALLNRPARRGWWQDEDNIRPIARYQSYQCADDLFILFCPEERKFWTAFCDLVDRPDLKDGERGVELRHEIQSIIGAQPRQHWLDLAIAHNLPIGPVNDGIEEVGADPQIAARGLFVEAEADGKPFTYIRQPAIVDRVLAPVPAPAPELGEHSDAILAELGFDEAAILSLRADGIVAAPPSERHIISSIYGDE
ncbi:MAG: CaiB/BaiF CoA transferase family protein, partial [Sphingopyxis sp.]